MKEKNLYQFLDELHTLEDKYGIYVVPSVDEHIDYDWDEEPYTSGYSCCLSYQDKDGNEIDYDSGY